MGHESATLDSTAVVEFTQEGSCTLEGFLMNAIAPPGPINGASDQTGLPQDGQVLRSGRSGNRKLPGNVAGNTLTALSQDLHDLDPHRMAKGFHQAGQVFKIGFLHRSNTTYSLFDEIRYNQNRTKSNIFSGILPVLLQIQGHKAVAPAVSCVAHWAVNKLKATFLI